MIFASKTFSLGLLLLLGAACTARPQSRPGSQNAASAEANPVGTETPAETEEVPGDPTLKKVIPFAEQGLNLGPKPSLKCGPKKAQGKLPLGHYINFEVVEDDTKFKLALTNFCGDITRARIVLFKAQDREPVLSFPLPTTPIENADLSFDSSAMIKGHYILAFEVGGQTIADLSSLGIEKGSLTFDKWVRLESISDF